MAEKIKLVENFLKCSVCLETFREPVSLGCNHSFCRSCLQDYWEKSETKNCPVCRRRSSKGLVVNFALKELCDSFAGRLEAGPSEKLKAEGKEQKEQLRSEIDSLKQQRQSYEDLEKTYEKIVQHSKKQAVQCERQIRALFSGMQQFLKEEEDRALAALREEQHRQEHAMGPELQSIREQLSSLSQSIQDLEQQLHSETHYSHTHSSQPRPRPKAGLLINQAKVLGNLGFRVWRRMRSLVTYSPVILDPNSADESLYLSEDLRGVRRGDTFQQLPDNVERFSKYPNVFGSEGFSSGTHQWDVEVGDHPDWNIGVAKESADRKGKCSASPKYGFWCLWHRDGKYINSVGGTIPVKRRPEKIRVQLDYDLGEVSFYDADHMTHLYTYKDTFTDKLFPLFSLGRAAHAKTKEIKICPSSGRGLTTAGFKDLLELSWRL